jgi:hypothetical protein
VEQKPQQRDLFTRRWRKVKAWEPSELQLQISLIEHLGYRCRSDVVYFHVPNGEERDKRVAAKLKAMGVLPGVADLVFVWSDGDGRVQNLYLELKVPGRTPSLDQLDFRDRIVAAGAHHAFAYSIDEALGIVDGYELLK